MSETLKVIDNDLDEITVTLDRKEIRGWSYKDDAERRVKMLAAREFVEGWFQRDKCRALDPRVSALIEAGKEARGLLAALARPDAAERGVSSQALWVRCVAIEAKLRAALKAVEDPAHD